MWKNEIYTMNEECYFFYEDYKGEQHQMPPTFANEYWEVYALHLSEGLFYAIVGLHGGKRVYYEKDSRRYNVPLYFVPIQRDLAYRKATGCQWSILTIRGTELYDRVPDLLENCKMHSLVVTYLMYQKGVLRLTARTPKFYYCDKYYRQTENGYVELKRENALKIMNGPVEI